MTQHSDVYQIVTDKIIDLLEVGVVPWHRPWKGARNLVTDREYRGVNSLLLNCSPFGSPYWLTFREAHQLGGKIRSGERSSLVVFWKWTEATEQDEEPKDEASPRRAILRYYLVFNLEQTEGVRLPCRARDPISTAADAGQIAERMPDPPTIQYGGDRAYYSPSRDLVKVPPALSFETAEHFYSTLYHELIHSTGHSRRLGRILEKASPFGSEDYSKEELVAEIGAAFLCGKAGIANRTLHDSASYIQGWLTRLQSDRRFVVSAAATAQKAADFILGQNHD